jgi:hypothetical protein
LEACAMNGCVQVCGADVGEGVEAHVQDPGLGDLGE